ncbi:MAG: SemiSWEET family transporter [bacterium]|nr:SemiSWEET family transporter [bacterium]
MFEIIDVIGYAGTVTAVSVMIPQTYRMYKTKSVEDISWGMLMIYSLNALLWSTYSVMLPSTPMFIANGIAFIISIFQITLKTRYRNNP